MKTTSQWPPAFRPRSRNCLAALLALTLTILPAAADAPGDIRFERAGDTGAMAAFPPAVFPHWVHRVHYRCDACHSSLFEMQRGTSEIAMASITAGESCGSCHNGEAAFDSGVANCNRCHQAEAE